MRQKKGHICGRFVVEKDNLNLRYTCGGKVDFAVESKRFEADLRQTCCKGGRLCGRKGHICGRFAVKKKKLW